MSAYRKNDNTFATRAIHEGNIPEQWSSLDVIPPISLSTTFKQYVPGVPVVSSLGVLLFYDIFFYYDTINN